jgi:hypothetical protein
MKRFIIMMQLSEDNETPLYFPCDADDADHAEEQALDAYPGWHCVTIYQEV